MLPPVFTKQGARADSHWGLSYQVRTSSLGGREFFEVDETSGKLTVTINVDHPFYERMYTPALRQRDGHDRFLLECLLLSAARAELEVPDRVRRVWSRRLRAGWGDALAAFLDKYKAR